MEVLSSLVLEAVPPLIMCMNILVIAIRLTTPVIEGMGIEPTPGSHPPSKAGEFFLDILMKRVSFPINHKPGNSFKERKLPCIQKDA